MTVHTLKRDHLGVVRLVEERGERLVERDTREARRGLRWIAARLAGREAAALRAAQNVPGVPRALSFDGALLRRSYLPGAPIYESRPSCAYFRHALRIVRALHRAGVAHNDLAKEANWLRTGADEAFVVDFQLATRNHRRGAWFRLLAYEDLRHLLKHKRTYCPEALTDLQRKVLAKPSFAATSWRMLAKPVYRLVTRGLLGWVERHGPIERQG
jgi:predicted Ser/Thr protein kinase